MDPKIIEIQALGRALHPGTLYDCRSDNFIPGVTLWDKELLRNSVDSRRQPKTDLNFAASDSLSDKAKLLDVNASLQASILGGLVDVAGSARFLRDNKSSANQSRVSMQYNQTTKFEQLTMKQLQNITYKKVFDDGTATHVVTAVLYGAQAFMVFDLTANENENKEEIEGNLNVMVRKIPTISVEGGGALSMNDKEKKISDSIKCTFYGDYELEFNPTTYIEALQVYKTLPSLLRKREGDAVPMKVWLYPLALLDEKAATLEREIHKSLISKAEAVLEELGNAEIICNDLITNPKVNDFQDVRLRLKTFQDMLVNYKMMFLKALRKLIPAIRGGKETEQALENIITIHHKSPFRAEQLNQWLENNQGEQNLLHLYTQQLSGAPVVKYSTLFDSIVIDPSVDTVMCFCFTSLKDEDPYLSALTKYLEVDEFEKLSTTPETDEQDFQVWFQKYEVIVKMKDNHSLFKSFFQANKDDNRTRFVIVSLSDPSSPGTAIRLYRKGKLVDSTFEPVSKPPAPKIEIQNRNLILKLQKSPTGSTIRFRVEYTIIEATDPEAEEEQWESIETPDVQENFTLPGIELTNQCWVRYRAISDIGVSEASDSALHSPKGKFKFSLGRLWNWINLSIVNELRTQMLGNLSTSWLNPSIIKSEFKNLVNNPKIPYMSAIPHGLKPGMALYFQGAVGDDEDSFSFNLRASTRSYCDIALQLLIKPNYTVECYTYKNRKQIEVKEYSGCSLSQGSTFVIFIVIKKEGYEIYLNGRKYGTCKHQIPVESMTTLQVCGGVIINTISIVPNWSTSTVNKEITSGMSHWELSNFQSDIKYPVCKPNQPYLGPIPGGINTGIALFFQGVVPLGSKGFEINLKTGQQKDDNVVMCFKTDLNSVVCNSCYDGEWHNERHTENEIFAEGEAFDIFMLTSPAHCDIIINGRFLYMFKEYIVLTSASTLQISGDVFMNTFGLINVDTTDVRLEISSLN